MNKIYYIANARMPSERAHAIQIAKMTESFIENGTDITLVIPHRKNHSKGSLRGFYSLRKDVPVVYLPVLDTYHWGKFGYYLGSVSFMISYFFYLWGKRFGGEKFLIYVIDMDQFSFLFTSLLLSPFFMELHDAKPHGAIFKWMLRRAKGVLTINSLIKKKLVETFGVSEKKILVFPNGIDLEFFDSNAGTIPVRKNFGLPSGSLVLYLGKCYGWKGLDIFVAAAREMPKTAFCIVGCDEEEVKNLAKEILPSNLYCVGQRPYGEVPSWLSAADVLVVLGTRANEYSYYHTSPMKLFEYMAVRRPIVASRTPAIEDIVTAEEVFFYEPDSAESLVSSLVVALKSTNVSKVTHARQKVENLSWVKRAHLVTEYLGLNHQQSR